MNKTEFSVFESRKYYLWFAEKKIKNLDDVLDKEREIFMPQDWRFGNPAIVLVCENLCMLVDLRQSRWEELGGEYLDSSGFSGKNGSTRKLS